MAENWDAVAIDVAKAIADVGFTAYIHRSNAGDKPWSPDSPDPDPLPVKVINKGLLSVRVEGSSEFRQAHTVAMSSAVKPELSDKLDMLGRKRKVLSVKEVAPGGVVLLYRVEIEQ